MLGQQTDKQKESAKKGSELITRIQQTAKAEAERKKKEDEEKKKKKEQPVQTGPEKGFLRRMYETYVGTGEKK